MDIKFDYNFYFKKDEWSEDDIIELFDYDQHYRAISLGHNVKDAAIKFVGYAQRLRQLIRASINTGKLKYCRHGGLPYGAGENVYYFDPLVIIKWALDKQLPLPQPVLYWYDQQSKPKPKEVPPYLDTTHPLHSKELKIAIETWEAVLQAKPGKPKTGSRKQLIENWLKTHHNELSNAAFERITLMSNPDGPGGAPKTE
ncbi:MAG: hypothetical protein PHY16_18215 [Methylobacter sp.]|nr:hypothetical protein [Methylobacter sp.]